MKNLYSYLIILTFFISCDNDSNITQQSIVSRDTNELPGNNDNPYDEAGWLHNELFESYYASGNLSDSISGIVTRVEAIADTNTSFKAIKSSTYHAVSSERVQYILDHKSTCVADIIAGSTLTTGAKVSLSTFINSLVLTFDKESS